MNDARHERFAIHALGGRLRVGRREGERLEWLGEAPAPGFRSAAWSEDGRRLAVLDLDGKRIQQFDVGADSISRVPNPVTLPKGSTADCLLLRGDVAYVGGASRGSTESLWVLRGRELSPVALPDGVGSRGKALDHLFLNGDRLVAVDDFVVPKWILTFVLREDGEPVAEGVHPLTVHAGNERVKGGATGARVFALYSRSVGRGGVGAHLAVLDRQHLDEIGVVSKLSGPFEGDPFKEPVSESLDPREAALGEQPTMAFVGDVLVLGNRHGLFTVDLRGAASWGTPSRPAPSASLLGPAGRGMELPPLRAVDRTRGVLDVAAVGEGGCVVAWDGEGLPPLAWVPIERLLD